MACPDTDVVYGLELFGPCYVKALQDAELTRF